MPKWLKKIIFKTFIADEIWVKWGLNEKENICFFSIHVGKLIMNIEGCTDLINGETKWEIKYDVRNSSKS